MKKQLEIINRIENKKVELGMNVELGLAQEIDQIDNKKQEFYKKLRANVDAWNKLRDEVKKNVQAFESLNNQLDVKFKSFQKQAQELGIELPNYLDNMDKVIDRDKKLVSSLNSSSTPLKWV